MIAPVVKHVEVPLRPADAFELFTARIADWWPTATHSVSMSADAAVRFDGRDGGHITEIAADRAQHVWGTVTEWEPPRRVAFTWHPGRGADVAQHVTVSFEPSDDGTAVTLEHRGWEVLGERADHVRANYDAGWDLVLGRFVDLVDA